MKQFLKLLIISLSLFTISCQQSVVDEPITNKKAVFEYCWKSIDEKYSFFELKKIDWFKAHVRFEPVINEEMTEEAFFDTLSVMMDLLQDGHSGIKSNFNNHKNVAFYQKGPENYDGRLIVDNYAKGWGNLTGGLSHVSLENNQIAYLYYGDFTNEIKTSDLEYIINKYSNVKGFIIDVRNNFGGSVNNVFKLIKHFAPDTTLLFKSVIKNGPKHNDFSQPFETVIIPSKIKFTGKVCVLTNRKVYSAGSVFTLGMRELSNVTIVGDTTGGGLGLPIGTELPNGWQIHFSASQIMTPTGDNFELGIPPDITINMNKNDMEKGEDTIIETAIKLILDSN